MQSKNEVHIDTLYHENDDIDLIQILLSLKSSAKFIFAVTAIGIVLSVVIALLIPKVYQSKMELSKPTTATVAQLNENSLTQYNAKLLLNSLYERVQSKDTFRRFVEARGLLQNVFPDAKDLKENTASYISEMLLLFNADVVSGEINGEQVELAKASSFFVSYDDYNESMAVDLVNQYIIYVAESVIEEITVNENVRVAKNLKALDLKIELAKQTAKQRRLFEIAKRRESNKEQGATP